MHLVITRVWVQPRWVLGSLFRLFLLFLVFNITARHPFKLLANGKRVFLFAFDSIDDSKEAMRPFYYS